MKKLSLLMLFITAIAFVGCSDDKVVKLEVLLNLEEILTEPESEFMSTSEELENGYYIDSFQDTAKIATFHHAYTYYTGVHYFSGFSCTNKIKKDNDSKSKRPAGEKVKKGSSYLSVFADKNSPARMTIEASEQYVIKGAWVTNCIYAYVAMTTGAHNTTKFTTGSQFILTATGYDEKNAQTGEAQIYLANYMHDGNTPVTDWIWFDLTPLEDAVEIKFVLSSTDNTNGYMNTPAYFCMDEVMVVEK